MQCPLQFAYDRDSVSSERLRRGNTFTALGNATHALEEAVHNGEFDEIAVEGLASVIDEYWNHLIEAELGEVHKQWPEYELPKSKDIPRYSIVFCNATERAVELATARRSRQTGVAKTEIEQTLVDYANAIEGRPDRYHTEGEWFTVIDIKSGVVSESIKPEHRHQLLTYCHLVRQQTGLSPRSIGIQDIEGNVVVEDVTIDEVENHIRQVIAAKQAFLTAVTEKRSMLDEARPAAETCAHCNYRVICPAYWQLPVDQRQSSDVKGVVVGATANSFTVQLDDSESGKPEFVTVTGCRAPMQVGSSVTVAGGHAFGNSIRAGIGTTVFEIDSPEQSTRELEQPKT
jgi:hypothetical protein